MPETTAYSAAQAYAVLRNIPEPGIVQAKAIELLQAQLNPEITYANQALSDAGQTLMKAVAPLIKPAPAKLTDEFINGCLVGIKTEFEVRGSGLVDTVGVLSVYLIDQSLSGPIQLPVWRRGLCVIAVLHRYLAGYYDGDGNKLWHLLRPIEMVQLPEQYKNYSGVTVSFHLEQKSAVKQNGEGAGEFWPAHS